MNAIIEKGEKMLPLESSQDEFDLPPKRASRWALQGMRTPAGAVIRLEVVRHGRQLRTSREAILRFLAALTAATVSESNEPPAGAP